MIGNLADDRLQQWHQVDFTLKLCGTGRMTDCSCAYLHAYVAIGSQATTYETQHTPEHTGGGQLTCGGFAAFSPGGMQALT